MKSKAGHFIYVAHQITRELDVLYINVHTVTSDEIIINKGYKIQSIQHKSKET